MITAVALVSNYNKKNISDEVFKDGTRKIRRRQPLKIQSDLIYMTRDKILNFLKAVFYKFYLVHYLIFVSNSAF